MATCYRDALWDDIKSEIRWEYGEGSTADDPYPHPGPFSFVRWCEYMMERGAWGDRLILILFSVMTGAMVTVVKGGPTLKEDRLHHNTDLSPPTTSGRPEVEAVVFYAGNHYSSCSEYK